MIIILNLKLKIRQKQREGIRADEIVHLDEAEMDTKGPQFS